MTLTRAFAVIMLCLSTIGSGVSAATTADAKVESGLAQFSAIISDPTKLAAWCKMSKSLTASEGAEQTAAQQEAVTNDLKDALSVLGPGFQDSWMLLGSLDPDTADGQAYAKVLEDLGRACGK